MPGLPAITGIPKTVTQHNWCYKNVKPSMLGVNWSPCHFYWCFSCHFYHLFTRSLLVKLLSNSYQWLSWLNWCGCLYKPGEQFLGQRLEQGNSHVTGYNLLLLPNQKFPWQWDIPRNWLCPVLSCLREVARERVMVQVQKRENSWLFFMTIRGW